MLIAASLISVATVHAQLFDPGDGMTDGSGNDYSTIVYTNGQEWTTQNLRTTVYANGDEIPHLPGNQEWVNATEGAWVSVDNNSDFDLGFGKMYNALAVVDPRNLCPSGWRVPSDDDFKELELFLGFSPDEVHSNGGRFSGHGGEFKVTSLQYWNSPNEGASNLNGFSAVGHGVRNALSGSFLHRKVNGAIWTSTSNGGVSYWFRSFHYWFNVVYRNSAETNSGLAVRCIKGETATSTKEHPEIDYMIFPNPASDLVFVQRKSDSEVPSTYLLRNVLGAVVKSGMLQSTQNQIDLTNLPAGVYILQIEENQNAVKIIKQ